MAQKYNMVQAAPIDKLPQIQNLDFSKGDLVDQIGNLVCGLLFIANMTRSDITSAISYLAHRQT